MEDYRNMERCSGEPCCIFAERICADNYKELLERAFKAMENAYAPYSNYRVGSCVLTKDNKYFIGANIENASYGLTNCAERNAIFQTYSNGYRKVMFRYKRLAYKCQTRFT